MNHIRELYNAMILASFLVLSSTALADAKGPLSELPRMNSGWQPVPCKEVKVCGITTTYSSCEWRGNADSEKSAAEQFLAAFGPALRIEVSRLRTLTAKPGLTSINSRFEQDYENRRVFGAEVRVISDREGRIREVINSYFPIERILGSGIPVVNTEKAEAVGLAAIGKSEGKLPEQRMPARAELVWFPIAGTGVVILVWELYIYGQSPFLGDYFTLVDANSGILLHQDNRLAANK